MKFIFSLTLWLNALKFGIVWHFKGKWNFRDSRQCDYYLLCLKGKGNNSSSQRGRGRGACVGICAFGFEVCRHLRKTNVGSNWSLSQTAKTVTDPRPVKMWPEVCFIGFTVRLKQQIFGPKLPTIPSGSSWFSVSLERLKTPHRHVTSIKYQEWYSQTQTSASLKIKHK